MAHLAGLFFDSANSPECDASRDGSLLRIISQAVGTLAVERTEPGRENVVAGHLKTETEARRRITRFEGHDQPRGPRLFRSRYLAPVLGGRPLRRLMGCAAAVDFGGRPRRRAGAAPAIASGTDVGSVFAIASMSARDAASQPAVKPS